MLNIFQASCYPIFLATIIYIPQNLKLEYSNSQTKQSYVNVLIERSFVNIRGKIKNKEIAKIKLSSKVMKHNQQLKINKHHWHKEKVPAFANIGAI